MRSELSSVEGYLFFIDGNWHVHDPVYGNDVRIDTAFALNDPICKKLFDAKGKRVAIWGEVFGNPPYSITVRDLDRFRFRVFPGSNELPPLDSIYGIDPDFTGGLSSVEYVRRMRDDDDE